MAHKQNQLYYKLVNLHQFIGLGHYLLIQRKTKIRHTNKKKQSSSEYNYGQLHYTYGLFLIQNINFSISLSRGPNRLRQYEYHDFYKICFFLY